MIAQSRQQAILSLLEEKSPLTVVGLERQLGVSSATLRRDLTFLETLGKIVRTHGGVMHPDDAKGEVPFDRKSRAALQAKRRLAEEAMKLARPGDTVFVDAGTSALEVGRRLLAMEGLTVVTNSIPLLSLPVAPGTRVMVIGGEVRRVSQALVGAAGLEWMKWVRMDVAFLGTSGIMPFEGPTTTEASEAGIKGMAISRARRVAVLADSSKWGRPAALLYAKWNQVDDLFTDHALTRAERTKLTSNGTKLHLVIR